MAKRKADGHAGGHGWFVTFADLMGLLMSFFVVLVATSNQDERKKHMMTGSFREAFGTTSNTQLTGMIELHGIPTRPFIQNLSANADSPTDRPAPRTDERNPDALSALADRRMALAAASLRQALQAFPEIAEISKNIMMEERPDGLDLQIVDQDGRAMFPPDGREPYERTRRLIAALAPALRQLSNRITITGHTSGNRVLGRPGYGPWDLTADRANAVRMVLEDNGLPSDRIFAVTGKGDSEPMFPDDPFLAANRRVSILIMKESPVAPRSFLGN
ncbi:flagellar motor protein MotB [Phreatobacter sp.]|uniref:OmpA/MotB family protein n=1 Tax=Phreatobacter sp. TaxID=1966341 RepID=UPI0022C12797|nr:flagellar motor protein MotB [Phreatobacter sp.]MCZ8316387.1 flagellar motor protein MotB [Phreatobacter sp.]